MTNPKQDRLHVASPEHYGSLDSNKYYIKPNEEPREFVERVCADIPKVMNTSPAVQEPVSDELKPYLAVHKVTGKKTLSFYKGMEADWDYFELSTNPPQTDGKAGKVETHYVVHGINGGGYHYIHAVKPIIDNDWKSDDCGLGDYWAGNQLCDAPDQTSLIADVLALVHALPKYSFLLNESGGVQRYKDNAGNWLEKYEVIKILDQAAEGTSMYALDTLDS